MTILPTTLRCRSSRVNRSQILQPTVHRVTLNVPVPVLSVLLPGNVPLLSPVKRTTLVYAVTMLLRVQGSESDVEGDAGRCTRWRADEEVCGDRGDGAGRVVAWGAGVVRDLRDHGPGKEAV